MALQALQCSECDVQFSPRQSNQHRCSACAQANISVKRLQKAHETRKSRGDYWQEIVERNKQWMRQYKEGLVCAYCGFDDSRALHFHHIDPATKKHSVSHLVYSGASISTLENEIDKCEVLCANCHNIKHYDRN